MATPPVIQNLTIGSADVYYGDPTDEMTLLDGLQGEIVVQAGVRLVGPRPNRARGALVKGSIYAFLSPPVVTLPVIDETLATIAKLFASAQYDATAGRLDFGAVPTLVSEFSLCIIPEVAKLAGVEEAHAIWLPTVAPANEEEFLRFAAGGEEEARPRTVTLQSVYAEKDAEGNAIPENSRLGWIGPVPSSLASKWTALPYTTG